tara:strand:+ start:1033 stop:1872 length:840 start_codon:yes stop_codon:yes gene_type:complete
MTYGDSTIAADGQLPRYHNLPRMRASMGEALDLMNSVLRIPENTGVFKRINIVAQHVSGRVYKNTLYNTNGFRGQGAINDVKALLNRVLRMYKKGTLKGDLLIHKTAHGGVQYSSDAWPVKLKSGRDAEHWFLTGSTTHWITKMADDYGISQPALTDSHTPQDIRDLQLWLVCVGLANPKQVHDMTNKDDITYARWVDKMRRYKNRVTYLNILKECIDKRTENYPRCDWSHYMREYDIFRFGAWCYKNGQTYYYLGGTDDSCHNITIHGNRNTSLGGIN